MMILVTLVKKRRHDSRTSERVYAIGKNPRHVWTEVYEFFVGVVLVLRVLPLMDKSAKGNLCAGKMRAYAGEKAMMERCCHSSP